MIISSCAPVVPTSSRRQAAGDLGRAIPLYEQILVDSVRVLGQDHPQTKVVSGTSL